MKSRDLLSLKTVKSFSFSVTIDVFCCANVAASFLSQEIGVMINSV